MSNLIDRQDAIVALRNVWNALWEIDIPSPTVPEYIEHHEQVQGIIKMVQDMIDTLPCTESQRESVQDVPDMNVGDMISRQDTIDALKEFEAQCWEDACFKPLMSDARNIIGDMPSAEPEIIHCKDCINADYSGLGTERLYCMDLGVIMHSDDYCSRAERRTDE